MKSTTILLLCILYLGIKFTSLDRTPRIYIFNVDQGDSILIKLEGNKNILIDGGDNFEVDRHLSGLTLFNRCHLDIVILTHPHADHLRGLNRVAQRCKIDLVISYPIDYQSRQYEDWVEVLKYFDVYVPREGDVISIGGAQLVFLGPTKEYKNINNSSVSVLLKSGSFDALFLGDLEIEGLAALNLRGLIEGELDVLKVPHHGGLSSYYAGASKLAPSLCLISVGTANTYGHPHQEIIEFYEDLDCTIRRTDLSGSLEVLIN